MNTPSVTAHIMGIQIPRPGGPVPRRNRIFIRIETDEGITGGSEATTEYHEHAVVAMIEQALWDVAEQNLRAARVQAPGRRGTRPGKGVLTERFGPGR